jgi:hypothetical protein
LRTRLSFTVLGLSCLIVTAVVPLSRVYARKETGKPRAVSRQVVPAQTRTPTIDGAKNPEMIPDIVAVRHFVLAVALPSDAPASQTARRSSYLKYARLSNEDANTVVSAVANVRAELDLINAEARQIVDGPDASTVRHALQARKTAVFEDAYNRIYTRISPMGQTSLDTFIRVRVKPQIQIFRD